MSPPSTVAPAPLNQSRLRYIDTLRGIAALLVVWFHSASTFAMTSEATRQSGGWLYAAVSDFDIGHTGVVVFFLISGFVIPFSIRPTSAAPVASFAIRRLLRIYPAYWLSVPLAAWAIFWIWGTPFSGREVLINLTLLQDLFGVRSVEGVYWTLVVELVFYALCIALLATGSLFDRRRIAALAAVLGLVFAALLATYSTRRIILNTPGSYWFLNLSLMLCGALLRGRQRGEPGRGDRIVDAVLWSLLALFAIVLPAACVIAAGWRNNPLLPYAAGIAIFLVGSRLARVETRLTDWLGAISYSVYLFHSIVFLAMEWWLLRQPADAPVRAQHLGIYMAAGLLVVLAVAAIVYALVERPFIRLGHRLASRVERRGAAAGAVGASG